MNAGVDDVEVAGSRSWFFEVLGFSHFGWAPHSSCTAGCTEVRRKLLKRNVPISTASPQPQESEGKLCACVRRAEFANVKCYRLLKKEKPGCIECLQSVKFRYE